MTPEEQRIAIAEACGIDTKMCREALEHFKGRDGYPDAVFTLAKIPDYLNDLNAMHEAEKVIRAKGVEAQRMYGWHIDRLTYGTEFEGDYPDFGWINCPAKFKAEAFLCTLGLR